MFQNYVFAFYDTIAEVKLNLEDPLLWEKLSIYYGIYNFHIDGQSLKQKFFNALLQAEEQAEKNHHETNYEDILLRLFNTKKLKGKNKMPKDMGRFFHILAAEEMILFPQVKKTLEAIKKADKSVYLLANAQKAFIKDELKYFGIKEYFDSIYVSSDYSIKKPNPDFFNQVIHENKLEKKKTLFIGSNYEIDLLPAKKLGYPICLVLKEGESPLQTEEADFIIENGDLKKILEF